MRVEDTGIGIPANDLPYIFNRFYKASYSNYNSENEGVGVGLSMTKELFNFLAGQ